MAKLPVWHAIASGKTIPTPSSLTTPEKILIDIKLPETVRFRLSKEVIGIAISLQADSWEEMGRNPEYNAPAEKMWVEFSNVDEVYSIFESDELPKNGSNYDAAYYLDGKNFYCFIGNSDKAILWAKPTVDDEDDTAYSMPFRMISGLIRFFNVVRPELIEKIEGKDRPAGRRFNGMPFSPVAFHTVSLRNYSQIDGEHTATDRHGVRFHFVRGHYMRCEKGPNVIWHEERKEHVVWRRSYWRGDATLGTVRKHYAA